MRIGNYLDQGYTITVLEEIILITPRVIDT